MKTHSAIAFLFFLSACSSPGSKAPAATDGGDASPAPSATSTSTASPAPTPGSPATPPTSATPTPPPVREDAGRPDSSHLDAGAPGRVEDAGDPPTVLDWTSKTQIGPGVETGECLTIGAAEEKERWLTGWRATLSTAHHANLWMVPAGTDITSFCKSQDLTYFIFDASQPELRVSAPDGGAIRIPKGYVPAIDVHEINSSDQLAYPHVRLELDLVDEQPGPELFAGLLQAQGFSIPADTTETLSWSCAIPSGVSIAYMISHVHRFTDLFTASADGAEVYSSANWIDPVQKTFSPPITPKTVSGESHVANTTASAVPYGASRDHNEMSQAFIFTFGARLYCQTTKVTVQ